MKKRIVVEWEEGKPVHFSLQNVMPVDGVDALHAVVNGLVGLAIRQAKGEDVKDGNNGKKKGRILVPGMVPPRDIGRN